MGILDCLKTLLGNKKLKKMVEKILQVWDWRLAIIGSGTSAFFTSMQTYMGIIALLLSIFSASATILLTATKLFDWVEKRREKKKILEGIEENEEER